jgi:hypothetical protein
MRGAMPAAWRIGVAAPVFCSEAGRFSAYPVQLAQIPPSEPNPKSFATAANYCAGAPLTGEDNAPVTARSV